MATKQSKTDDPQLDTDTGDALFEVLTQAPNGHRTIRRLHAKDRAAAEKQVTDELGTGAVVGAAVAGAGLGSGDAA